MKMMKKPLVVIAACSLLLLGIFFATDPEKVPAFALVLPFVLCAIILFTAIVWLLRLKGVSRGKAIRVAVLCSGLPMIVLVLQSVGQLTIKDVIALTAVFLLSYFYMSRIPMVR